MRGFLLALFAGALAADVSVAQQPWITYAPPASPVMTEQEYDAWYTYNRAYRKFVNSPYTYRTFSSSTPGAVVEYATPFGMERHYRGPTYEHRRITPTAYESHGYLPGYGGYRTDPWTYERYDVPGGRYGWTVPRTHSVLPY